MHSRFMVWKVGFCNLWSVFHKFSICPAIWVPAVDSHCFILFYFIFENFGGIY